MIDRRTFAASALASLAACAVPSARAGARQRFSSDPFALGVASGDPASDGFVIWTRLVGDSLDERPVRLTWEVAEDEGFRRVVRTGSYQAVAALAHSVHVEIGNLRAGRPYWYRFHAGATTSPVGRSLTFDRSPAKSRFALASCQNWEHGYFTAYRDMLAANVDFVLHVGDYIYERTWGTLPYARPHGLGEATDLDSYRARYALYRTDPSLQAAHAAVPFIATWDDHEVSNDYAGLTAITGQSPEEFAHRRAAAYQAYFEHMPMRPSAWRGEGRVQMYRRLAIGDLIDLHVLDARQYRDAQACGSPSLRGGRQVADCPAIHDVSRTLLGPAQEAWLYNGLANERAHWTTIAQQMLFAKLDLTAGPEESVWSDFWDGYTANRQRLVNALATPAVRNAIILGGDIHSWWVSDIKADYTRADSAVRGSEFITTCLASRNPSTKAFRTASQENPHIRYMNDTTSGYTLCDVDRRSWQVELRSVESLTNPASECRTLARFVVEDGRPGPLAG